MTPISCSPARRPQLVVAGDDARQLVDPLQAQVAHALTHRPLRSLPDRGRRPPPRGRRGRGVGVHLLDARRRRRRASPGTGCTARARRRGTGRPSPAAASRCSTSPSGTCRPRSDPLLVKAHGLWAEHMCDAPMEQWTVANETYAAALDDPDDALGRAYGQPSAGRVRPGVVRHGAAAAGAGRLRPGRRRPRRRRARRRPAAPDGGRRPGAGTAGATSLGAARAARRLRPHRACGRRSPSPTATSPTGCSPRTAGGHWSLRLQGERGAIGTWCRTTATSSTSSPTPAGGRPTPRSTWRSGMVVEDRASGFCGDVVTVVVRGGDAPRPPPAPAPLRVEAGRVPARGPAGHAAPPAGRDRPARRRSRRPARSPAAPRPAQVAAASRIWVEGRHDAELRRARVGRRPARASAIVVEPMHGIDDLVGRRRRVRAVAAAAPRRARRPPRHRVQGVPARRRRSRTRTCSSPATRSSTCGPASGRGVLGLDAWPDVPRGVPWKEGMCRALGTDPATLLAAAAQPGAHLRRPPPRARRRRRAPHRLRRPTLSPTRSRSVIALSGHESGQNRWDADFGRWIAGALAFVAWRKRSPEGRSPARRRGRKKRKPFLLDLYSTAVGKKYVMAITGHHRHRLRHRPHDRQPQGVPRPDRSDGERSTTSTSTASSSASCSCRCCPGRTPCGCCASC